MLAKKYKLSSAAFPSPSHPSRSSRYLAVSISPNSLTFSRFGVIVGLKYDKRSTTRHHLKRAIFKIIRQSGLWQTPGRDVVIIIKKGATSSDFSNITNEASTFLSNL